MNDFECRKEFTEARAIDAARLALASLKTAVVELEKVCDEANRAASIARDKLDELAFEIEDIIDRKA